MYRLAMATTVGGVRMGVVGRVVPPRGPVERYRRTFRRRWVQWDAAHQVWEVRERNEATGQDERVTLVTWTVRDPQTGQEVRGYRPFNHGYVSERLEDWSVLRAEGLARFALRAQRRNREKGLALARDKRQRFDEFAREDRRWLGVLAAHLDGRPMAEALVEKVPLIVPGVAIGAGQQVTAGTDGTPTT